MSTFRVLTLAEVRKILVDVFTKISGLEDGRVLIETKADRRPSDGKPYITLWTKNVEYYCENDGFFTFPEGIPSEHTEEAAIQYMDHEVLITVQVSVWGDGAQDIAGSLVGHLQNSNRWADLWKLFGFSNTGPLQDLSLTYGAKIQQRALFNFDFYAHLGQTYDVDWFYNSQWDLALPSRGYGDAWQQSSEDEQDEC